MVASTSSAFPAVGKSRVNSVIPGFQGSAGLQRSIRDPLEINIIGEKYPVYESLSEDYPVSSGFERRRKSSKHSKSQSLVVFKSPHVRHLKSSEGKNVSRHHRDRSRDGRRAVYDRTLETHLSLPGDSESFMTMTSLLSRRLP